MRNHFLRAKGVTSSGGGGDSGGGGGSTCGANDSGGTNEWAFTCAKGDDYFDGSNEFTASIDTANKIAYLATDQNSNKFRVRKITNTGTISWAKHYTFSGTNYSNFEPRKGKSLSTGKQVFIAQANYSGSYYATVICINADGSVEWCKRLTPGSNSSSEGDPYHLTIDSNDNIYFIFKGDEPNADGTAGSDRRYFVIKMNSSGALQWQKVFKSLGSDNSFITSFTNPNGLAVDSNYLYITNTRNNARSQQIVTLNVSDGTVYAVKHFGSDGTNRVKPATFHYYSHSGSLLVKDSSGDFYMLYPAYTSNSGGSRRDIFITKFDSSYTVDWSVKFSLDSSHFYRFGNSGGFGITVTPNVKNIIFSCIIYNSSDNQHEMLYIAKFDSSGSLDWQRVIRGVASDSKQPCDRVNTLESDNADHFYLSSHLPWTRDTVNEAYNFYFNKGESVLKHTSCSAIPTGYITDNDPHNILSSVSGSPSGFGKIESTSAFSASSASCVIQSTPFSDDSSYGSIYTATNPTGNFTATSQSITVADVASSDRYEDLTYL